MYIIPATTSIPDPWIWLRADYSSSMRLINNTSCSVWNDWRGYTSGMSSSVGRTPYYTASGYRGKPSVKFPPVSTYTDAKYFEITSSARIHDVFSGSTGYTIAVAYYCSGSSGSASPLMSVAADDTSAATLSWTNAGILSSGTAYSSSNGDPVITSQTIITSTDLTSSVFVYGVFTISSSLSKISNGVTGSMRNRTIASAVKSNNYYLANVTSSRNLGNHTFAVAIVDAIATYPVAPIRVGIRADGIANRFFTGEIYEMMFWPRPLSEGEAGTVMRYFERWR
jgi:hypothetical protein